MIIKFYKYQGTGNDFIMIDNRDKTIPQLTESTIKSLCSRRFGIGADGLILLENTNGYDFKMVYYNSDGRESTMCGNGGRCIVKFAQDLGMVKENYRFMAIDGEHEAYLRDEKVHLKMIDIKSPQEQEGGWFIQTGSPHHIVFSAGLDQLELVEEARKIRYNGYYADEGVNVNFVDSNQGGLTMRTYERGVEDETYSCGTGVTAAALVSYYTGQSKQKNIPVHTKGGDLSVTFDVSEKGFKDVWLIGPATYVFKGEVEI